jgi:hypothetical protein
VAAARKQLCRLRTFLINTAADANIAKTSASGLRLISAAAVQISDATETTRFTTVG